MNNTKVLAELEFNNIINESCAQTQTGIDLLNKYKSYLMTHDCSYGLVNSFIKEAQSCRYDNGVNRVLEELLDYIDGNKTIWALATVCEGIRYANNSKDYLNRNALKHVEPLLELDESEVVKRIRTGALKDVMYCESFRTIAQQIYKEQPVVESCNEYVIVHPISMIENVGDGHCFEVAGNLYKMDDNGDIMEAQWSEVSNTFKTITNLLESNNCTVDSDTIEITAGNAKYTISESEKVVKVGKEGTQEFTVEQLRENNRLVLMTANPRFRNQLGSILEGIALIAENYGNVVNLDNTSIYSTKNDRFVVIESKNNLFATLLQSNHCAKWTINENAIDAVDFIKSKTNVQLSEKYQATIANALESRSEEDKKIIEESKKEEQIQSYKERIETLTEKFKNDPIKLAVISKLAQDVSNL